MKTKQNTPEHFPPLLARRLGSACLMSARLLNPRPLSLAVSIMLAITAAQAIAEAASASGEDGGSDLALPQGARSGLEIDDRRIQAFESTADCTNSPLWEKTVDPAQYMFGCKEIEDMLHGNTTLVGNGQVRDVYLVEYGETQLVLKVLRQLEDPEKRRAVLKLHETEKLTLDAVRGHPNIVGMLGVCDTTLATEYYTTSVYQVIWGNREPLSVKRVVSMALDAARGLQALHEASIAPIVHFDMKPLQLLVDDDGRVMLNDFNVAQFLGTRGNGVSCPFTKVGSFVVVSWRAPEIIAGKPLTEKVDIYAMGMIFFSLMARKLPFPRTEKGREMILRGERPAIDPSWHPGYMKVVQDMWQEEPADRPSARQVVARLEHVLASLSTLE